LEIQPYRTANAITNSSRVVMLISFMSAPTGEDRWGASYVRQQFNQGSHFRRGNAVARANGISLHAGCGGRERASMTLEKREALVDATGSMGTIAAILQGLEISGESVDSGAVEWLEKQMEAVYAAAVCALPGKRGELSII
jgi:hypothetical protein